MCSGKTLLSKRRGCPGDDNHALTDAPTCRAHTIDHATRAIGHTHYRFVFRRSTRHLLTMISVHRHIWRIDVMRIDLYHRHNQPTFSTSSIAASPGSPLRFSSWRYALRRIPGNARFALPISSGTPALNGRYASCAEKNNRDARNHQRH
jgi:hypothetical protein